MNGYDQFFQNPLTLLGAGMMRGADPRGEGLGGLGFGLLNTANIMREQEALGVEQERARQLADLQIQTFRAKQAQLERARQQQEAFIQTLPEAQRASAMVNPTAFAQPAAPVTPRTELAKIAADEAANLITPEQAEAERQRITAEAARDPGEIFKEQWSARKDVQKQEATYREVANRASQIMEAVNNPGAFSDITLANNIAKFLDPGSVVRPSETEVLREAGGLVNSIQSAFQSAAGQGEITERMRKDIRKMMGRLLDIYEAEYAAQREETGGFLERRQMPMDIMGRPIVWPEFSNLSQPEIGQTVNVGGVPVKRVE